MLRTLQISRSLATRSFSTTRYALDVKVKTLSPGDGKTFPKKGDTVTMHYVGTLLDSGKKFDSSRDRGSPFQTRIGVGQVIKGWDEGVPKLSLGEKATLTCSPDYAYGNQAVGGVIPANSSLVFEVAEPLFRFDQDDVADEVLATGRAPQDQLEALNTGRKKEQGILSATQITGQHFSTKL